MKTRKQFFLFPPVMILALFSASLGYEIQHIQDAYSLSYSCAGLFSSLQSAGMIVSIILCFCVFAGLNKSKMVLIGALTLAGSIMLLSMDLVLFAMYAVFFMIGLSMNIPDTMTHALLADMSGKRSSFYISMLHALWALVGVIGPFYAMFINAGYKTVFLIIGLITALCAVIYWLGLRKSIKRPLVENKAKMGSFKKLFGILKRKGMVLLFATSLLCSFVQMPLIYFIRAYTQDIAGSEIFGAIGLSSLYLGFFIGPVLYAAISHKVEAYKLMTVSNTLALIFMGVMVVFRNGAAISLCTMLAATCMGPSLPILFSKACESASDDTAAASALIFFGVAIAALIAPPIIGAIGDEVSLRIALLSNSSVYVIVIVLSVLLYKFYGKPRKQLAQ